MIRALWILVKVGIVIGIILWVAERPGTISIDWMNYTLTFHVGFFILILMAIVALGIVIFSIFKTILDFPKNWSLYRGRVNREKGLRALTLGLTAVAAGDAKLAKYQSHKAQQYLPEGEALSKLLAAQAARLNGDELEASKAFMKLMEHKDAAFLGIRGLLQTALDHEDFRGAQELTQKALALHPKQGWLLKISYDLEIKAQNWETARKTLYRLEKAGGIDKQKANSDRVAMLLAEAEQFKQEARDDKYFKTLQKSYSADPFSIPTVLKLARCYLERGKRKTAIQMIKKQWQERPHPGLVTLWGEAFRPPRKGDGMARVKWFEELRDIKPESVEGLQALAGAYIHEALWGDARKCLQKAEEIRPNVNLYKIWAYLEERYGSDEETVKEWLQKAADAPRERVWVCAETGRIYDEWVAVSDLGLFNTIRWDFPQASVAYHARLAQSDAISGVLDVPKKRRV
ncbi:MAG: hypothetical protein GC137_08160 [Alphaproteobacteria bacterium]|nr:hypothetical protein [Alphaproteobacteria bacterium]